jgi:hypothetical protein
MQIKTKEKNNFLQKYMKYSLKIYSKKLTIRSPYGLFLTYISTLKLLKTLLKMSKTLINQVFLPLKTGVFVKIFTLQNK